MLKPKSYSQIIVQLGSTQSTVHLTDTDSEKIVQAFPYFQTHHILRAIIGKTNNELNVSSLIKMAAVYSGDRQILFNYLNRAEVGKVVTSGIVITENQNSEAPVIQKTEALETKKIEKTNKPALAQTLEDLPLFEVVPIEAILPPDPEGLDDMDPKRKQFMDIIDRFVANDASAKHIRPKTEFFNAENKAKQSVEENEEYISETLAEIFVQQKRYPKAIRAYETLSLKNPEKSVFFAIRIKEIKQIAKQNK